ncbi:MAG TPA: EthD domain-containing protein [Acidimicrobiales bacterium]
MGVKAFTFVRRKPGMEPEEFHRYWRDVHAARIAGTPALRRHVRRYELNHRLAEDYQRDREQGEVADTGFDGVAVLWFDSVEAFDAWRAEPAVAELTVEDMPKFCDDTRLFVLTRDPDVIVDTPRRSEAQAKMLCILRRNPALDLDTFHDHWLRHHGGLFQTIPELNEPLLGYDQNHGIPQPDARFDGVTEQWFESLDTFAASLGAEAHATVVGPDVVYMLDPTSIHYVMAGPPTVVIDG